MWADHSVEWIVCHVVPIGPIVCKCLKMLFLPQISMADHERWSYSSVAESCCYVGCTTTSIWDEISQRGHVGPLFKSTLNNFFPAYFNCWSPLLVFLELLVMCGVQAFGVKDHIGATCRGTDFPEIAEMRNLSSEMIFFYLFFLFFFILFFFAFPMSYCTCLTPCTLQ